MRAIFRFCIFPVIILGALLITAEYLLFDKNPDVVKDFDSVDYNYSEDSLVFRTADTLSANVAVHNLAVSDYNDTFRKHDHLLQCSDFQYHSSDYYEPERLAIHHCLKSGSSGFKSGLLNREIAKKDKQVYGIRQKAHGSTDTSKRSYSAVNRNTVLGAAGKVSAALPCLSAKTTNKHITPLSNEIFDNMQNTVKNKVKSSLTFSLHPNPATDKLIVQTRDWDNIESIQIFTMNGKSVYKTELPQKEIDVGSFASGLYILIITNKDESQYSQKVVIHRE